MDMFETMHNANGIGLAATQVGSLERVIVVDLSDLEEMKELKPILLINPEIVGQEGTCVQEEGCLSIPDVRDDVERAESIKVKFKNSKFRDVSMEVTGLLARVILHEIDHLDGVLFLDRIPKERRKLHTKALKQIQKNEIEVSYPIVSAEALSV
jgi:peptide deformylase